MNRETVLQTMAKGGLLGVLPGELSLQSTTQVADALLAAPLLGVVVALQNGRDLQLIRDLTQRAGSHMVVGAGQVETTAQAAAALQAGAHFIVSPAVDFALMAYCHEQDVLYLPGVISGMAAHSVQQRGGKVVCLRTGGPEGPNFVSSMMKTLPGLQVIVTGDVGGAQVRAYAASGAMAVMVSDALYTGSDQRMADLIKRARQMQKAWDDGVHMRQRHLSNGSSA